jgi:hypothetical protein
MSNTRLEELKVLTAASWWPVRAGDSGPSRYTQMAKATPTLRYAILQGITPECWV